MAEEKYKIIAVTNRRLASCPFLEQIERLACQDVEYIVLREKDLSGGEYDALAKQVLEICARHDKKCILHNFITSVINNDCAGLHLPLRVLSQNSQELLRLKETGRIRRLGVSVHSVDEALDSVRMGADYLFAGHIFATDCKKDVSPRGLDFLKSVCDAVEVPVYAIGGISFGNIGSAVRAGAAGGCMMSECMKESFTYHIK